MTDDQRLSVLRDYAAGRLGTREATERAGLADFAELLIAMSQNDLAMPRPVETAALIAHRERARAILLPRLRNAA